MIAKDPLPLKSIILKILLFCCGLITAYILFVSLVSVWVGLNHPQQDGFWMPVATGAFLMIATLCLFLRLLKFILNQVKEKDFIDL